jgi:GT2 family glycosyltransferase
MLHCQSTERSASQLKGMNATTRNADSHDEGLTNLTFIIPVRIDTADRLWNLSTILRFIEQRLGGAEIVVVEQDAQSQLAQVLARHPGVRHVFRADSGWFRKAECVNAGALAATRRYVCCYDTDILLAPQAMQDALKAMAHEGWKLVLPFNRIFLDVRGALRQRLGETLDLGPLGQLRSMKTAGTVPDASVRFVEGGIFIAERETFLAEGGLNRHMVSYGWEDTELHKRFTKLGYPILHLPGFNLVHLDHSRGPDSRPNEHYGANKREFLKIKAMPADELKRYVEDELSITERGKPAAIAALRAVQRRANRFNAMTARAFLALLTIQVQAHGAGAILRRLVGR